MLRVLSSWELPVPIKVPSFQDPCCSFWHRASLHYTEGKLSSQTQLFCEPHSLTWLSVFHTQSTPRHSACNRTRFTILTALPSNCCSKGSVKATRMSIRKNIDSTLMCRTHGKKRGRESIYSPSLPLPPPKKNCGFSYLKTRMMAPS